jgi:hypothetical protein
MIYLLYVAIDLRTVHYQHAIMSTPLPLLLLPQPLHITTENLGGPHVPSWPAKLLFHL